MFSDFTDEEFQAIAANAESLVEDELTEQFLQRKKESLLLSDSLKRLDINPLSMRVHECGSWLQYRLYPDNLNDPRCQRLTGANFCGHVLCPCCAWRNSRKHKNQLVAIINHLNNYRYLFLTLTVRNVYADELNSTVDMLLNAAWHRLINRKKIKNSFKGYFRSLEITHDIEPIITQAMYKCKKNYYDRIGLKAGDTNPTYNTYHPHIHALLAVAPSYFDKYNKDYLNQKIIRDIWAKSLKADYDPYVDIRAVYDDSTTNKRRKSDIDVTAAILEVGKYISKSNDYIIRNADKSINETQTDETIKALCSCLANRRKYSYGGIMQQAKKDLKLNNDNDLVHTETHKNNCSSDYIQYSCSWIGKQKTNSGYVINTEYISDYDETEKY